jgi:hypothetical protein
MGEAYLKSLGLRSLRLHLLQVATFFSLPLEKTDFILISPPQAQKNCCVTTFTRAFLLISAIVVPPSSLSFAIEAWIFAVVDYRSTNRIHCVENQMKYTDFVEKIKSPPSKKSGH